MCGRFSLTKDEVAINQRFQTTGGKAPYIPRFNGAPGQNHVVITNTEPTQLNTFKWGLIPFWAKDPKIGNKMINAKSETVHEKPSFRNAFKAKRCLVLSDGFFEWKKLGKQKVPHYVFMEDHQLFAMAGLWETWQNPDGNPVNTFTILTTTPNTLMQEIHHRMPVILTKEKEKAWLTNNNPEELKQLMLPFPENTLQSHPVSKLVNSPLNDTPEIIEQISLKG